MYILFSQEEHNHISTQNILALISLLKWALHSLHYTPVCQSKAPSKWSVKIFIKLFHAKIQPILSHGSKIWGLTKNKWGQTENNNLEQVHTASLRRFHKVYPYIAPTLHFLRKQVVTHPPKAMFCILWYFVCWSNAGVMFIVIVTFHRSIYRPIWSGLLSFSFFLFL